MEEIFPNTICDATAIASLKNITASDIQKHFDEFYTTDNVRTLVFGNFSETGILKIIEKLERFKLPHGEEKSFPTIRISENRGAKTAKDEDKIHFIFLSPFPWMKKNIHQRATFSVLRSLLTDTKTGRMYRELRDKGLLYHIFWGLNCDQNSLFYSGMSFSADNEVFSEAVKVVEEWILKAKNGEFSEEYLEKVKISAKNGLRMSVRSDERKVEWFQDEFLDFVGYNHDGLIAEIDKVTKQDVVDLAKLAFEHFDEGGWR